MILNFTNKQFEELGVNTIFLFGSQSQGTANVLSDFDFGILLENPAILDDIDTRMKLYNKLYDIFSSEINYFVASDEVFRKRKIKKFVTIDIVFLDRASLQIQYQALKNSKILYNKSPQIVIDFKQRTLERYADFAPFRREFNKLILERI